MFPKYFGGGIQFKFVRGLLIYLMYDLLKNIGTFAANQKKQ